MAHVEKRQRRKPDGTLGEVRWRVRWRDDTGRSRTRSFAKRRDADRWRTKIEHDLLSGAYIDQTAGQVTLAEYSDAWVDAQPWAPSTEANTRGRLRNHILPAFGDRPIGSLRPSEIQAWAIGLTRVKGLKPSTAELSLINLKSVLDSAVTDRLIPSNPCASVEVPTQTVVIAPPTPEQVDLLASHLDGVWRVLVITLAGMGLRVSEALGLTVDRVDWLGRSARIDRQLVRPDGEQARLTDRLKSPASHRTVPLPETVLLELSRLIEEQGTGPDGVLFHDGGAYLTRQRVRDKMRSAAKAANREALPRRRSAKASPVPFPELFSPHDLRHFYASMLIAGGLSPTAVQARLGHASAATTLDIYGHLWPSDEEKTRVAVDAVLGRGPGLASRTRPASGL